MISPEEMKQRMNLFTVGLRRAGIKVTHQRLEVFRELAKSSNHPDAETIYKGVRKRVPTVSLDTVYRTLWLLLDLGLITTLGPARERARFDANMKSHHHFVCSKCGKTFDVYSNEFDQLRVPDNVKTFGHVEKMHMEIRGICLECSQRKKGVV